ncbi:TetR/AcrR family transcriptional regulator [Nonomuraea sp. NPDC049400]|uniref:TetR/AcrR family transcriptional regulator n=1 Tax=Nonomuraea sp. NPDC049400 TaxID=3364352 RepID=UPI0037BB3120
MARMPKEHLEARRRQILAAARRCFLRNGFHATSMQDVLAEAELSAGAVYRYFKSKDDIIAATASEALAEVALAFEADDATPPDLDDIVDLVLGVDRPPLSGSRESAQLLVQVWSEALRSPSLCAKLKEVMQEARNVVGGLVARHQRRGLLSADVPAEHVAAVLMALVDGFLVLRAVYGHADPAAFRSGLKALMSASAQTGQ